MNCFIWSNKDNDWIVRGDFYKKDFKKYQGTIHNSQLITQILKEKRNTQQKYTKHEGYAKFNVITREVKPSMPIKYYKYQCHEHMIRNGMLDVFYLAEPKNQDKKWYLLLQQYQFTLDHLKRHDKIIQKGSKADQCMVQNLTWSGFYLGNTL